MNYIEKIYKEIKPLRQQLINHPVYAAIDSIQSLKIFLKYHVFAVWDFMSLLKALQKDLTCVSVPWVPRGNPIIRKLINEIVLIEETDEDKNGLPISHFELYIKSMKDCGAETNKINELLINIQKGQNLKKVLSDLKLPQPIKEFVLFTFNIIDTKETHKIASIFTFGREELIPDMFPKVLYQLNEHHLYSLENLIYYFERHIDVDSDIHGPMSIKMIKELCRDNISRGEECLEISSLALEKRIQLWDSILDEINENKFIKFSSANQSSF